VSLNLIPYWNDDEELPETFPPLDTEDVPVAGRYEANPDKDYPSCLAERL